MAALRKILPIALLFGLIAAVPPGTGREAVAQIPRLALAARYRAIAVDSPRPVVGGNFGNGPLVSAGDLNDDGVDDIAVVQPAGPSGDNGRIFALSGADGALIYEVAAPDPSTGGLPARFGQFVSRIRDIGSCLGATPAQAGLTCPAATIGDGDQVDDLLVGAIQVDFGSVLDIGRGYLIDGATGTVLKRIDMPPADRAAQGAANARPQFARTMLSPWSDYPETAANAVRLGDMDGEGKPDIVIGASQYHEAGPSTHLGCDPGPCSGSGRVYVYRGEDIVGTDPAALLETAWKVLKNPMAQTDDPDDPSQTYIESFGHSLVPIGDSGRCLTDPGAGALCRPANSTTMADGLPDVVIVAHWTDFPEGFADSGVAYLVDGPTSSVLFRFEHPQPQRGALWSFTLSNQPAVGDVAGNGQWPDVVLPSYAQHVQYAGQGRGYVMNGDFKARGDLVTVSILDDPTPAPGGNYAVSVAGIGDVAGDTRNEFIVGAWGPVTPGDDRTIVNDVHVWDAVRHQPILTLDDPDQQPGSSFGTGVASLGDVNDDGSMDFAVGASQYTGTVGARQGRVYLFRSVTEIERSVTLTLRRHLVAQGVVSVPEGATSEQASSCEAGVRVRILRGDAVVGRTTTDAEGAYRMRLPDPPGRYRASVGETAEGDVVCLAGTSPLVRHRH